MGYEPLLPAANAPAMWILDLYAPDERHVAVLTGPDRTVYAFSTDTQIVDYGERRAAGVAAFGAVADAQDILVPAHGEEWPIAGPDDALEEASALRRHGLLLTWLQALGRYRQWYPGAGRALQHVSITRGAQGIAVVEVGGIY